MRTIEEKNGMIANFMGVKFKDDNEYINELKEMRSNGIFFEQGYMASELKYHSSWDWLMPVVEEIKYLEVDPRSKDIVTGLKIANSLDDVHYCVCKFIEWYNEQELCRQ